MLGVNCDYRENPPPPLAGGGWGEGLHAAFVRFYPSPPTPSHEGRGRIFSILSFGSLPRVSLAP